MYMETVTTTSLKTLASGWNIIRVSNFRVPGHLSEHFVFNKTQLSNWVSEFTSKIFTRN